MDVVGLIDWILYVIVLYFDVLVVFIIYNCNFVVWFLVMLVLYGRLCIIGGCLIEN